MAKRVSFDGDVETLALVATALKSKSGGVSISDRANVKRLEGEQFHLKGVLVFDLVGKIGQSAERLSFRGVSLNDSIDLILHYSGATEDHARKALEVMAELNRAERDGRPIEPVTFTHNDGTVETLTPDQMVADIGKVNAKRRTMEGVAKDDRYSRIIKQTIVTPGPVLFESITVAMPLNQTEETKKVA